MVNFENFQNMAEEEKGSVKTLLRVAAVKISQGEIQEGTDLYKKLGQTLWKKGELRKAIEIYKKVIEIQPENIEAQLSLGIIYRQMGLLDAARKSFCILLRYDTKNIEALIELGLVCQGKNDIEASILAFKKVIELNSEETIAYEKLGELYEEKGDISEAIEKYYTAAEYYTRQNNKRALDICKIILKLDPNYSGAYKLINKFKKLQKTLLEKKKNTRKKSGIKEKITSPKPEALSLAEKHKRMALVYTREAKYNDAIGEYQEALRLVPDDASIFENLGDIFYRQYKDERAIHWLSKAKDIYLERKESKKVIKIYKYILKIKPGNLITLTDLGELYLKEGLLDKAMKIQLPLAERYTDDGLLDKAMILYERLLEADPDNRELFHLLVDIYRKILQVAPHNTGIRENLIQKLREVKDKENLIIEMTLLIKSFYEQEYYNNALACCEELLKLSPSSGDGWNYMGKILTELKEYEKAIKCFNNILEEEPDNTPAQDGREKALKAWSGSI